MVQGSLALIRETHKSQGTIHLYYPKAESYLEGQGDFLNRTIIGITRVPIWLIGVIHLLAKSP